MNSANCFSSSMALATQTCFFSKTSMVSSLWFSRSSQHATRKLVMPDMAEVTTTLLPSVPTTMFATLSRASMDPTEVPPNFITVNIV